MAKKMLTQVELVDKLRSLYTRGYVGVQLSMVIDKEDDVFKFNIEGVTSATFEPETMYPSEKPKPL